MIPLVIVHYNTPEMTEAAVRSINKHTPGLRIVIFENSTERVFTAKFPNVEIIDNTFDRLIDFDAILSRFPRKMHTCNDWGSVKHCYTIDYLWADFPEGFVLADSDILVKKDISPFFSVAEGYAWAGKLFIDPMNDLRRVMRLLPFLCYINVPMCRKYGIRYFDPSRMWKLDKTGPDEWYDTGASFLEDCRAAGLSGREIDIDDYIEHFTGASYTKHPLLAQAWLNMHEKLWK